MTKDILRGNLNRMRVTRRAILDDTGISLAEMLVVLALIALVSSMIVPRVIGYLSNAKVNTATVEIRNIKSALEFYFLETGSYPTEAEGLAPLIDRPKRAEKWNGPYITGKASLNDPWNNPYQYVLNSNGEPVVRSLGKDGKEGGEGEGKDISSDQF